MEVNMAKKDKKDKKKNHVSLRAMIIAMIVALLGFLGINNFEVGNGDGSDSGKDNGTGVVLGLDSNNVVESMGDEERTFEVDVQLDTIIILEDGNEVELTLDELAERLANLEEGTRVKVYNHKAYKASLDDVIDLVGQQEGLVLIRE